MPNLMYQEVSNYQDKQEDLIRDNMVLKVEQRGGAQHAASLGLGCWATDGSDGAQHVCLLPPRDKHPPHLLFLLSDGFPLLLTDHSPLLTAHCSLLSA